MKKTIHCLSVALLLACGTSTVFSMTTDDVISLVDCYSESNYKPFLSLKNTEMLDKVTIWIETLLPTDGTLLDSSVPVGGTNQPVDATRDAFKDALTAVVEYGNFADGGGGKGGSFNVYGGPGGGRGEGYGANRGRGGGGRGGYRGGHGGGRGGY